MKRELQFNDDKSQKFWTIDLKGIAHTVTFGRIGTTGQTQTKDFGTEEEAKKSFDKLVQEKRKKGYVDIKTDSGAKKKAAKVTKASKTLPAKPAKPNSAEKSARSGTTNTGASEAALDRFAGLAKELTLDLGNDMTLKFVLIPAGTFLMGSSKSEQLAAAEQLDSPSYSLKKAVKELADEGPQHEVTITKPFYLGICPVTLEQYEAVMGSTGSYVAYQGPKKPVDSISWDQVQMFCSKLTTMTGKQLSLPTEAQWEYACRAGTTTKFSFGDRDEDLKDYAVFLNSANPQMQPVGEKKPNAWGLYDMHGNVLEWCADWYGTYSNVKLVDPQGPATGSFRVLRGGSWSMRAPACRAAQRFAKEPRYRGMAWGFRVCATVDGPNVPSNAAKKVTKAAEAGKTASRKASKKTGKKPSSTGTAARKIHVGDQFWEPIAKSEGDRHPAVTPKLVKACEKALGIHLPASLLKLLRKQNGGRLADPEFVIGGDTYYLEEIWPIRENGGIGSLAADYPDHLEIAEGELPNPELIFPLCGDGHWFIALDYRSTRAMAEPEVIYLDIEGKISCRKIADSFAKFLEAHQTGDDHMAIRMDEIAAEKLIASSDIETTHMNANETNITYHAKLYLTESQVVLYSYEKWKDPKYPTRETWEERKLDLAAVDPDWVRLTENDECCYFSKPKATLKVYANRKIGVFQGMTSERKNETGRWKNLPEPHNYLRIVAGDISLLKRCQEMILAASSNAQS